MCVCACGNQTASFEVARLYTADRGCLFSFQLSEVNSAAEKKICPPICSGIISGQDVQSTEDLMSVFTCSQFDTYLSVSLNDETTWGFLPGMNIRTNSTCALTDG